MKRIIVYSACVIATLALAAVGYLALPRAAAGDDAVAMVNGEPVATAAFERAIRGQRAAVIEYYRQEYGATVDERFWQSRFGDETPADALKSRALQMAVRERVELALAQAHGLIADTSEAALMREMARENERRATAVKNGQPVYGPSKLDAAAFLEVYLGELAIRLKGALAQTELAATDEQLRGYYDSIKETRFKREDTVSFEKVSVSYRGPEGVIDNEKRTQASKALTAIRERMGRSGHDLATAVAELRKEYPDLEMTVEHEALSSDNARSFARNEPALYEALVSGKGDRTVSDPIDEASNGLLVAIRVLDRLPGGYESFEDAAENVRKLYADQSFEAYVAARVREADVRIDEERYEKTTVD